MIAVLPGVLTGALSVVAAAVIAFAVIVLIASYYRFQHIVQKAEDTQPEEMGVSTSDVLRVQLARYFAECARRGSSFSLSLIHVNDASVEVRLGSPFIESIKKAARHDDITCAYDGQTAALITEAEPDDAESILTRITHGIVEHCPGISGELLRVGIASYPGHGLSGNDLLNVAREALDNPVNKEITKNMRARFQKRRDVILPLINAVDGMHCAQPGGAFYAFINVADICKRVGAVEFSACNSELPPPSTLFQLFALYKHGVATLDRAAFGVVGSEGQHYIRISLASDIEALKTGVSRLAEASVDVNGFQAFLKQSELYT